MIDRCYNKSNYGYKNYGGRGIKVHDEWLASFWVYAEYMEGLPGYGMKNRSVDRIDNHGNYVPWNVRWATPKQQRANTRVPPRPEASEQQHFFNKLRYKRIDEIRAAIKASPLLRSIS